MNRDHIAGSGAHGAAGTHEQTLALYRLLDELRERHPMVEIESCSSGGARIDHEILKRTERVWTSDCNDALERQTIQRGASMLIPPELMGAHIGPHTAHTTHRTHTLSFRAATAIFGHLGLEWNLLSLDEAELTARRRGHRAAQAPASIAARRRRGSGSTPSPRTARTACTPPTARRRSCRSPCSPRRSASRRRRCCCPACTPIARIACTTCRLRARLLGPNRARARMVAPGRRADRWATPQRPGCSSLRWTRSPRYCCTSPDDASSWRAGTVGADGRSRALHLP